MKKLLTSAVFLLSSLAMVVSAQEPQRLVPFSGSVTMRSDQAPPSSSKVTFALYEEQTGGTPLWTEVQEVDVDASGKYSVILGSHTVEGLPADLFAIGTPRWFGVTVGDGAEQPRLQLLAVPYAVAAGSAASLGGRAASDFVLSADLPAAVRDEIKSTSETDRDGRDGSITNATANRLVKYTDALGNQADSSFVDLAGNLGVGTSNPNYPVQVHAAGGHSLLQFTNTTTGAGAADGSYFGVLNGETLFRIYNFENGNVEFYTNNQRRMTVRNDGNVGIGTQNPNYALQVHSTGGHALLQFTNTTTSGGAGDGSYFGVLNGDPNFRIYNFENAGIDLYTNNLRRLTVAANGNLGVGTNTPTARLHVAGDALVDGNIGAKYQDVAEWVEVSEPIEAGTVVVIDPDLDRHVRASGSAYQYTVAGAVSAQPGLILGEKGPNKVMVAQSGRVKIKVDAKYGAIKAGDLLVTSPTPGYAMRSQPTKVGGIAIHRPGTLLGKALEPLQSGKGEILALLTLQ